MPLININGAVIKNSIELALNRVQHTNLTTQIILTHKFTKIKGNIIWNNEDLKEYGYRKKSG